MYGEYKLYIYYDIEPGKNNKHNPYNVRIVIENAEGMCVSSNEVIPITEEFIKIYDEQFASSYEDDYKPTKTKERMEKKYPDAVSSQSAATEPSNRYLVIPVSSGNGFENMQHVRDVSDRKDIPANILSRLDPPLELQGCPLY